MIPKTDMQLAGGLTIPVYRTNTVILGAGAAGMNCAARLYQDFSGKGVADAQDRIAVVTAGIQLGASRMSGSDKQTYYKVGTNPDRPDAALDFAKTLTAAGCMHGDIALAEGACSLRAFFHLVDVGVPFPHDAAGNYPGYKTDHDPRARATSVGPKTSYFMSNCLQKKVERYGVPIFDQHEAVHLLTRGEGEERRIVGLVTLDKRRLDEPGHGLTIFLCENMVLAAGGPGALYEASVYPPGQIGAHGLAFKAGLRAQNMIEWQFGLASTKFRWNVSGTYMQALPRIFSTDQDGGDERDFLPENFPTTAKMATNIFLKGYQWPFDAQRLKDLQSSLIDLFVTEEVIDRGRRVYLDFREDPRPADGMKPFAIDDLEPEAREYLVSNGATQATPIERLAHMNPLAIDIYTEHDIDLHTEPLEIAVCAQHQNGGFVVSNWWESTIPHTFCIGETSGTHGIKRPGGSALNSGQAGGIRSAQRIANVYGAGVAEAECLGDAQHAQVADVLTSLQRMVDGGALPAREVLAAMQRTNSETAAHLRKLEHVTAALEQARETAVEIREKGLKVERVQELALAIQTEHMALTQLALLEALKAYLLKGGGSRGSYVVLHDEGEETGTPYHFLPENEALRDEIMEIGCVNPETLEFAITTTAPRPIPEVDAPFEVMWTAYRSGDVFKG